MRSPSLLITMLLAAVSFSAHAAPEFLKLDVNEMRAMELESIPLFLLRRFSKARVKTGSPYYTRAT